MAGKRGEREFVPTTPQLLKHPLAFVALVPKEAALFTAGAIAGAAAKSITAPLDRIKLLMKTHGLRAGQEGAKKAIGFIEDKWIGEQTLQYNDVLEDIEPEEIRPMGNYVISITWPDGFSQHEVYRPNFDFLEENDNEVDLT